MLHLQHQIKSKIKNKLKVTYQSGAKQYTSISWVNILVKQNIRWICWKKQAAQSLFSKTLPTKWNWQYKTKLGNTIQTSSLHQMRYQTTCWNLCSELWHLDIHQWVLLVFVQPALSNGIWFFNSIIYPKMLFYFLVYTKTGTEFRGKALITQNLQAPTRKNITGGTPHESLNMLWGSFKSR